MATYPTIKELGGYIIDLCRTPTEDDTKWSAANASIGHSTRNNFAVILRSSNYVISPNGERKITTGKNFVSKLYFSELDKKFKVKNLRQIDTSHLDIDQDFGLQDSTLIYRDDAWHVVATVKSADSSTTRVALCGLETKKNTISSITKQVGIDPLISERGWTTSYKLNQYFDFVRGANSTIKNNMARILATDNEEISGVRNATNLLDLGDETYLSVVYKLSEEATTVWVAQTFGTVNANSKDYVHYFVRHDNYGNIIAMTGGFRFYKPGIEIAAGLTEHKKDFYISYGSEEVSSHIAVIPKEAVLQSLIAVNY